MPWIYLLLAGLFEIGFALGMKYSEGFSKPLPTAATVVSALISLYLMSQPLAGNLRIFCGVCVVAGQRPALPGGHSR